jgi:acetaldehyde dehydrogenase
MSFRVAIVGSGNIGTDLLLKVERSPHLEVAGVAGIDPASAGLRLARDHGHVVTDRGLAQLLDEVADIDLAFDATSAAAHPAHAALLAARGIRSVDLTPAALGPAVVPPVNLTAHRDAPEVNLVTCGAQATVPIVAALSRVAEVEYAETVSTVASRSAGPGTRQNIDEFTTATARALETIGGARAAKAIIILNPADPPIMMRNTIYARIAQPDADAIGRAVTDAVADVAAYVPGYRLAMAPLVADDVVTLMVEVEGAGDHLEPYAGNLDIMTSAAVRVAELHAGALV